MLRSAVTSSSSLTASWSDFSLVEILFGGLPQDPATLAIAVWISKMLGMQDASLSCSSSWFASPCFLYKSMLGLPATFLLFPSREGISLLTPHPSSIWNNWSATFLPLAKWYGKSRRNSANPQSVGLLRCSLVSSIMSAPSPACLSANSS